MSRGDHLSLNKKVSLFAKVDCGTGLLGITIPRETPIRLPFHDILSDCAIGRPTSLLENKYDLIAIEQRAFKYGFAKGAIGNPKNLCLSIPRYCLRFRVVLQVKNGFSPWAVHHALLKVRRGRRKF